VKQTIKVAYGATEIPLELDRRRVGHELQIADVPTVPDVEAEILRALAEPLGAPPLRELVKPGQKTVIVGDDGTRPTPTDRIVPPLLDELNAGGVTDDDIFLVIATGTHRSMSKNEIVAKYGRAVTDRVRVVNHDCMDQDNLVSCGRTRRGADIRVNEAVLDADVRVGVGNIVPHHPTGWSGGAKILLPGVADRRTTGQMHLLGATQQQLGKVLTPCRQEMEDFAGRVGLDFIVNTVLDRHGRLVRVVAGHFVEAHRRGVSCGQEVFGAPFSQKVDITISSTYPVDFDLFQADKGLFSAAISTRRGGEVILLSPCHEGVSPTHREAVDLAGLDDRALWQLVESGSEHDPLSIAEVMYFNSAKRLFAVTLVSEGISPAEAGKMGFRHLAPSQLPDYLQRRLDESPEASVGILRDSAEVLPIQEPVGD